MKYPLYNDSLCPKLWHMDEDGYKLDSEVKNKLSNIAQDFVDGLKNDHNINIRILDVVIMGSAANYNWTNYSDIDLHIVTDYSDLDMTPEDAQTMFDALKVAWNLKHNIKVKGHDIELYVQDKSHKAVSSAEYSVIKNKWNKEPKKEDPKFDKELIKKKFNEYKSKINSLVKKHDADALQKLQDKLYKFRQAGLDKGGELSEENITFKILRAYGYLDKLKDKKIAAYDKKMSVKENDINEGTDDIAKSVYLYSINGRNRPDRDGNSMVMYGVPTQNQMKYLVGKSGSFSSGIGNSRVYYSHDRRDPNRIKFTWQF